MESVFKVVSKALKGKEERPTIVLKGQNSKDKLEIEVDDLDDYEIEQLWTVKVVKEQQTLS